MAARVNARAAGARAARALDKRRAAPPPPPSADEEDEFAVPSDDADDAAGASGRKGEKLAPSSVKKRRSPRLSARASPAEVAPPSPVSKRARATGAGKKSAAKKARVEAAEAAPPSMEAVVVATAKPSPAVSKAGRGQVAAVDADDEPRVPTPRRLEAPRRIKPALSPRPARQQRQQPPKEKEEMDEPVSPQPVATPVDLAVRRRQGGAQKRAPAAAVESEAPSDFRFKKAQQRAASSASPTDVELQAADVVLVRDVLARVESELKTTSTKHAASDAVTSALGSTLRSFSAALREEVRLAPPDTGDDLRSEKELAQERDIARLERELLVWQQHANQLPQLDAVVAPGPARDWRTLAAATRVPELEQPHASAREALHSVSSASFAALSYSNSTDQLERVSKAGQAALEAAAKVVKQKSFKRTDYAPGTPKTLITGVARN